MDARSTVTARAPAKINLGLAVGPVRSDGFHELATVFHAVSLWDEVVARPSDESAVSVEGGQADRVPTDASNLALRAADALARYVGVQTGVRLHIHKRIPVAGGMAGGSADAAAALVACDALWETGLGRAELAVLAARIGSDVPFALTGGTALGTGRGERLSPVMVGGRFHWVVAVADGALSTTAVYAELDRLRAGRPGRGVGRPHVDRKVLAALRAGDAAALAGTLRNDLQDAACSLEPSLPSMLDAGRQLGALAGVVSGSGPTCVFLTRDSRHAAQLAADLAATGVDALAVTGPVPGARLVPGVKG